jgi:hypothetical protein
MTPARNQQTMKHLLTSIFIYSLSVTVFSFEIVTHSGEVKFLESGTWIEKPTGDSVSEIRIRDGFILLHDTEMKLLALRDSGTYNYEKLNKLFSEQPECPLTMDERKIFKEEILTESDKNWYSAWVLPSMARPMSPTYYPMGLFAQTSGQMLTNYLRERHFTLHIIADYSSEPEKDNELTFLFSDLYDQPISEGTTQNWKISFDPSILQCTGNDCIFSLNLFHNKEKLATNLRPFLYLRRSTSSIEEKYKKTMEVVDDSTISGKLYLLYFFAYNELPIYVVDTLFQLKEEKGMEMFTNHLLEMYKKRLRRK